MVPAFSILDLAFVCRSGFSDRVCSARSLPPCSDCLTLLPAIQAYRSGFKPSQQFTNLVRGAPGRLQPPIADIEAYWTRAEKAHASDMLTRSFVGSCETVRHGLSQFIVQTGVDELIVAGDLRSPGAAKVLRNPCRAHVCRPLK